MQGYDNINTVLTGGPRTPGCPAVPGLPLFPYQIIRINIRLPLT